MSNRTKVLFRFWRGDVIALFPEEPSDELGHYCVSYQLVGQHAGAHPQLIISGSRKATPEEFATLVQELRNAPYEYDLQIIEGLPRTARQVRLHKIAQMRKGDG